MFLEEDGDGERLAEALALCAERGVGVAVLKVGRLGGRRARPPRRTPARVAGDQRVFRALVEEAGGGLGRAIRTSCSSSRACWPSRGRGRAATAGSRSSPARAGTRASPPTRRAGSAPSCPRWPPRPRERLAELLPDAATIGNPLDYTAMIWGDTDLLAADHRDGRRRPGDRPAAALYDHPQGLAPGGGRDQWAAVRAGIVAGADETEAATLVASTLPDLIDDRASGELADRGVPAVAGLRTALACAQALARPAGDPGRLRRDRRRGRRQAIRRRRRAGRRLAGRGRGEGAAAGGRDRGARGPGRRERGRAARAAAAELGWPVALKLGGPAAAPQERGRARCASICERADEARAAYRELSRLAGGRRRRACWSSGWRRPASSSWSRPAPTPSSRPGRRPRRHLDRGARRRRDRPAAGDAERVEAAIRSLRGAAALGGGRGREPVDLASVADARRGGGLAAARARADLLELNPVVVHRDGCVALDAVAAPGVADRRGRRTLVDLVVNRTIGGRLAAIEAATHTPTHSPLATVGAPRSYDAIVVGGGHNGLTTAAYLARAGLRVVVLERRRSSAAPA